MVMAPASPPLHCSMVGPIWAFVAWRCAGGEPRLALLPFRLPSCCGCCCCGCGCCCCCLLPFLASWKLGSGGGPLRITLGMSCSFSSFNCSMILLFCMEASQRHSCCSRCIWSWASSSSMRLLPASMRLWSSAFSCASGGGCAFAAFGGGEFSTPPQGHQDGTGVPPALSSLAILGAGWPAPTHGEAVCARRSVRRVVGVGVSAAGLRVGLGLGAISESGALQLRGTTMGCRQHSPSWSQGSLQASNAEMRLLGSASTRRRQSCRAGSV
mmetsp:Transcript_26474/g.76467  ORF Transcript_26474/g.76467 Transcript_26474/m.76467 type:complete len:269 (+) Transcript_26474:509-1315(+)